MRYIKEGHLHTKLYTKPTDTHMYLHYNSEHPPNLKRSIPFSQFLRLKKIHSESCIYQKPKYICVFLLFRRQYPYTLKQKAWEHTVEIPGTKLLSPKTIENHGATPIMFIMTYNRDNSNFRHILSNY